MVVAVCFVSLIMPYAVWYSFSVFFVAMFEEFGWSRGTTAAAFSVNMIVYGLSAPFCGMLIDRFGPRVVLPVGAGLLGFGLVASSRMDSLWQFYVYYGLIAAVGVNLTGSLPNSTIVQRWFVLRRGTALGIASTGAAMGLVLMVPVAQYIVSSAGWRTAYVVFAALTVLTVAPLALIFHRRGPQELGLQPDGLVSGSERQTAAKVAADRLITDRVWAAKEWTVRSAAATRRFWLLWFGVMLSTFCNQSMMVHQIAFMVDIGFDRMAAALAVSLVGLLAGLSRFPWGYVSDRIGRELAYGLSSACVAVSIAVLVTADLAGQGWLVYVYAFLFGLGFSAGQPVFAAIVADIFTGRNFAAVFGLLYIGVGIGSGLGPWLAGWTHDLIGNYYLAFAVNATAVLAGAVAMWLAAPRKVRLVAGWARRVEAR